MYIELRDRDTKQTNSLQASARCEIHTSISTYIAERGILSMKPPISGGIDAREYMVSDKI